MSEGSVPIPLRDAGTSPIVYGLCLRDGHIRYVGMSRNPRARFRCYRSPANLKGNDALKDWLIGNDGHVMFVVLHEGNDGLCEAEKRFIADLKPQLFNIIAGGMQSWRVNRDKKPWEAGRGVPEPSLWVIRRAAACDEELANELSDFREAVIRDMTDSERCEYEISIAAEHRRHWTARNRHQKWIERCGSRMIECLNNAASAENGVMT